MKALTVSVGYADLLAITLPHVAALCDRVLVITSPDEQATAEVCGEFANVDVFRTDAFYRGRATFNKGLAIEEGLDVLGRTGWLWLWDADIVLPDWLEIHDEGGRLVFRHAAGSAVCSPDGLYVPRRRFCIRPADYHGQIDWTRWALSTEQEHAGFCQFFHADDPALSLRRPWYGTQWQHAGGCDSEFLTLWPAERRHWLPFEVLHLGEPGINWWAGDRQRAHAMYAERKRRERAGERDIFAGEWI